jgi:hypothetical protein
MMYRVGETTTPCFVTANMKAESAGTPVQYVVGDKAYDCRATASEALASMLDAKIKEMTEMHYVVGSQDYRCPMSARQAAEAGDSEVMYRVAGIDFECEKKARAALEQALAKVETVSMSVKSDGDKKGCGGKSAGATTASATGASKCSKGATATASGDTKPCCKSGDTKPCCKSIAKAGVYVVGDKETPCEKTAKLLLAEEKLRQIVETVATASL